MRALLILGMLISMNLGLVGTAGAESIKATDAMAINGQVQSVDTVKNTVAVDSGLFQASKQFQVTPETLILRDGQEVSLSSLQEGDSVLISYETNGDQMISQRIILNSKKDGQQS